jgi:hypothetical protein
VLIAAGRPVRGLGGERGAAPPADNWQDKAR